MLRDAWDNIASVCRSAWAGLSAENRSFFTGMGFGVMFGAVLTWLVF